MTTLLEQKLRNSSLVCITDAELASILSVADNQRYSIVKRAIVKGDLIHIRRGLYCLGKHLTTKTPHPFELAQKIYWPSYVSLESALSYHGLIPEAVYSITSVATKRSKEFHTPLGNFSYIKIPSDNFFVEVERKEEQGNYFFIAKPWKAILDYLFCYKKNWHGLEPLVDDLRIEVDELPQLSLDTIEILMGYYKSQRIKQFLNSIAKELQP